jgi:lysophospholipase L1-like esterase
MKKTATILVSLALVMTGSPGALAAPSLPSTSDVSQGGGVVSVAPGEDYSSGALINDPSCYENQLGADPWSYAGAELVELPFTFRANGTDWSNIWVSPQGALSHDGSLLATGLDFEDLELTWSSEVYAPMLGGTSPWGWFDEEGNHLSRVFYGFTTYRGFTALCVTWLDSIPQVPIGSAQWVVNDWYPAGGYWTREFDWDGSRRNSFQALLVDRSDTGVGNFDIVYNYDTIQWQAQQNFFEQDTGDLQYSYTQAGWSLGIRESFCDPWCWTGWVDGRNDAGVDLPDPQDHWFPQHAADGSRETYLDSSPTGLAVTSTNSTQVGRHIFPIRDVVEPILPPGIGFHGELVTDWTAWFATWDRAASGEPDDDGLPWSERTYVALGDSYQSGEGAWDYVGGTATPWHNRCHRSQWAYPVQLHNRGFFGDLQFEFWACSGATIGAEQPGGEVPWGGFYVDTKQTRTVPWNDPVRATWDVDSNDLSGSNQKSALERVDSNTAVVTIGLGGNDVGFSDILTSCVKTSDWDSINTPLFNWTCEGGVGLQTDSALIDLAQRGLLKTLIDNIHSRAPQAQIYFLGYPRFFPEHSTSSPRCGVIRGSDQVWINNEIASLNKIIKASVEVRGAEYVDIYDVGDGFELCSSDDPDLWFMNGALPNQGDPEVDSLLTEPVLRESFHPNGLGHFLIANRVQSEIQQPPSGWAGSILPGETLTSTFTVTTNSLLSASVRYRGSDIELTLASPSGEVFNRVTGQDALTQDNGATWEWMEISDPEVGEWRVDLYGAEVDEGGEPFLFQWNVEPLPNQKPTAVATLERHGTTVTIDGSASSDPDGDIVEIAFDFGDGTVEYGTTATHTYNEAGEVLISLWVKDDQGEYDFADVGTVIEVPDYEFGGFTGLWGYWPAPTRALAGQPIPLGFDLGKDWGNDIMAQGSPTVQRLSCTTGEAMGEARSAVGPWGWLPVYNRWTHRYVWTWNTKADWAGTCQELTFDFNDGSSASHTVNFFPWRWNPWWCPPPAYWQAMNTYGLHL